MTWKRTRLMWTLCAIGVLWAAPGAAAPDDPAAPLRIWAIDIVSPVEVDREQLLALVDLRPGDAFVPDRFDAAMKQIAAFYKLKNVYARTVAADEYVSVEIVLAPAVEIESVVFEGNRNIDAEELQRAAGIRAGGLLDEVDLDRAARALQALYAGSGYSNATIMVEPVMRRDGRSRVVFRVSEGPRELFRHVEVTGETLTALSHAVKDAIDEQDSRAEIGRIVQVELMSARARGHWEAQADVEFDASRETVRLTTVAGPLHEIRIRGAQYFEERELLDKLKTPADRPFQALDTTAWRNTLQDIYLDEGFFDVRVTEATELTTDRVVHVFTIAEGLDYRVSSIELEIPDGVDAERLRKAMTLTASKLSAQFTERTRVYTEKRKLENEALIERELLAQGYLDILSDPNRFRVWIDANREGEHFLLTVHVVPGRRYRVGELRIGGDTQDIARMAVEQYVSLGGIFNLGAMEEAEAAAQRALRSAGYIEARVQSSYEVIEHSVDVAVRFNVDAGTYYHVGPIIFRGNRKTNPDSLRRVLPLEPGDIAREEDLIEAKNKLFELRLFRYVDVTWFRLDRESQLAYVLVDVEERDAGEISVGFGVSTGEGTELDTQIEHRNILGDLRTVGGQALVNYDFDRILDRNLSEPRRTRLTASLTERQLLGANFKGRLQLRHEIDRKEIDAYFESVQGAVGIDREISRAHQLTLQYVLEFLYKFRVTDLNLEQPGLDVVGKIQAIYLLNLLDDRFDPSNGMFLRFIGGWSNPAWRSDFEFVEGRVTLHAYRQATGWLTLLGNVGAGAIELLGSTLDIPRLTKLRLGGTSSLRGYSADVVGPKRESTLIDPATGERQLISAGALRAANYQIEARFRLYNEIDVVGFHDAGIAWQPVEYLGNDIRHPLGADSRPLAGIGASVGLGMLYHTPIGPVRIDWAYRLVTNAIDDPPPTQRCLADPARSECQSFALSDRSKIHFYIGGAF